MSDPFLPFLLCQISVIAALQFGEIPNDAVSVRIRLLNVIGGPASGKVVVCTDFNFFRREVTGEERVKRGGLFERNTANFFSLFGRIDSAQRQPVLVRRPLERQVGERLDGGFIYRHAA